MIEKVDQLRRYNFWDQKNINLGFPRDLYLSKVEGYLNTKLVKVFVGQRRVGKSYLMRQIISKLIQKGVNRKNIFYLNKEVIDFEYINTFETLYEVLKLYENELKPVGRKYLFFDEIQMVDQWEKLINSLSQSYVDDYEIFITGSNSRLLSGELSTLLSGRYVEFEVFPFSYGEYLDFNGLPRAKSSLIEYLQLGGLPELNHLGTAEVRVNYLNSLVDTIILRDIVQRYKIKDTNLLLSVFRYLLGNVGFMVSTANIVNYFKNHKVQTNYETISSYLEYLTDSFIVHPVERYDIKGKSTLQGIRKYYVNDFSFYNYIRGANQSYGMGQLLENFVYLHLKQKGFRIFVGSLNGKEVDFVVEKGQEKKYIQVTYMLTGPEVIEREFSNLEAIKDHFEKIVISLDDITIINKQGIKHICAWDL